MSDTKHSSRLFPAHPRATTRELEIAAESMIRDGKLSSDDLANIDLHSVADRLREGQMPVPPIRRVVIDGKRDCAVIDDIEGRIVARFLADGLRRILKKHRPPSSGKIVVASDRGIRTAVQSLRENLQRAKTGWVHLFDVEDCFPSLDPFVACDRVDRWSRTPSCLTRLLRPFYEAAHVAGVPGTSQGLAPSSALADAGLQEFDRDLARMGLVVRYADNGSAVSALGPDEFRARADAVAARHGIRLHKWAHATFAGRRIGSLVHWLGVDLWEDQVDLPVARWAEIDAEYHHRLAMSEKAANDYLAGIEGQWAPIVVGGHARVRDALDSIRRGDLHARSGPVPFLGALSPSLGDSQRRTRRNDAHTERQQTTTRSVREAAQADDAGVGAVAAPTPGGWVRGEPRERWIEPKWAFSESMMNDALRPAIDRAKSVIHSHSDSHALAAIATQFLACNDFGKAGDPRERQRYVANLGRHHGLQFAAFDPRTGQWIIDPALRALVEALARHDGPPFTAGAGPAETDRGSHINLSAVAAHGMPHEADSDLIGDPARDPR